MPKKVTVEMYDERSFTYSGVSQMVEEGQGAGKQITIYGQGGKVLAKLHKGDVKNLNSEDEDGT